MNRTARAALLAGLVGFALVAGAGWLLGFPATATLTAGAVGALLAPGLIVAAALRAGTFSPDADPGCPTISLTLATPTEDTDIVEDARG